MSVPSVDKLYIHRGCSSSLWGRAPDDSWNVLPCIELFVKIFNLHRHSISTDLIPVILELMALQANMVGPEKAEIFPDFL